MLHIARIDSSIRTHKLLINVNVGKHLVVAIPQLPVELFDALVTASVNFVIGCEGQYRNWRDSGTAALRRYLDALQTTSGRLGGEGG